MPLGRVIDVMIAVAVSLSVTGTLAGMSRSASSLAAGNATESAVSGGCSKATADRLVSQMYEVPPAPAQPPRTVQLLCGAFLGSGSQAMVFSINPRMSRSSSTGSTCRTSPKIARDPKKPLEN